MQGALSRMPSGVVGDHPELAAAGPAPDAPGAAGGVASLDAWVSGAGPTTAACIRFTTNARIPTAIARTTAAPIDNRGTSHDGLGDGAGPGPPGLRGIAGGMVRGCATLAVGSLCGPWSPNP